MAYNPDVLSNFYNNYSDYSKSLAHSGISSSDIARRAYQSTAAPSTPYYLGQGTDYMYNGKYRPASDLEDALIDIHRAGDYLMNWQQVFAGPNASEEEKDKFRFHADRMNIFDSKSDFYKPEKWASGENWGELAKFGVSLPGQMAGGLLQAPGQLLGEVVAGVPYTEYKKKLGSTARHGQELGEGVKENGHYLIPEYSLDTHQRLSQAGNAGINVLSFFTGGFGRVAGTAGKAAFTNSAIKNLEKELGHTLSAQGRKEIEKNAKNIIKREGWEGLTARAKSAGLEKSAIDDIQKYATKAEKWERRSKGVVRRAYEKATGNDSNALGVGSQALFDAGQEAIEEFTQQYLEQGGRYKNEVKLEDALNAAAWGALGGATMSGGMGIVNKGIDKAAEAISKSNKARWHGYDFDETPYLELRESQQKFAPKAVVEQEQEILRRMQEVKGATSLLQVTGDANLLSHQHMMGDEDFINMYTDSQEGADFVLDYFKVSKDEFDNLIRQKAKDPDFKADRVMENWLKNNQNVDSRMFLGRTPGTKNGGFLSHCIGIFAGSGLRTAPEVAAQIGSDFDGDKTTAYLKPDRFENIGYAIDFYADPEMHYDEESGEFVGEGIVPAYYAGIGKAWAHRESELTDRFRKLFGDIEYDGKSIASELAKRISQALRIDDTNTQNYLIGRAFMDVRTMIDSLIQEGKLPNNLPFKNGLEAAGMALRSVNNDVEATIANIIESRDVMLDQFYRDTWEMYYGDNMNEEYDEIREKVLKVLNSRGTVTEDIKYIAQFHRELGLLVSNVREEGAIIFRQNGQTYYPSKEQAGGFFSAVAGVYKHIEDFSNKFDIPIKPLLKSIIRAEFGMAYPGMDPTTAVEGLIDSMVIHETYIRANRVYGQAFESGRQFKEFIDIYREVSDEYVDIYEEVIKNETSQGLKTKMKAVHRNKLKGENGEINKSKLYESFGRRFAFMPIDMILPSYSITEDIASRVLGDIQKLFGKDLSSFTNFTMQLNDSFITEFFDDYISQYGERKNNMEKEIRNAIENLDLLAIKTYYDNHGDYGPYTNAVLTLSQFYNTLLDPDIAVWGQAYDFETNIDNKIIQDLMSPDNRPQRTNSLCSLSLYTQFSFIYGVMKKFNNEEEIKSFEKKLEGKSENEVNNISGGNQFLSAVQQASELAQISSLHSLIASSLLSGNTTVFEKLVNLDVSLEEKISFVEMILKPLDSNSNFVIDSLLAKNTEFDLSGLSVRVRKARDTSDSVEALFMKEIRGDISTIKREIVSDPSIHLTFINFIKRGLDSSRIVIDKDILFAQVYESMITGHHKVEKGDNEIVATSKTAACEIQENGGIFSYSEDLFGLTWNNIDIEQAISNRKLILDCLADPKKEYTIVDDVYGETGTMSRDTLFAEINIILNGREPNADEWIRFFEAYPQVASMISDSMIQATPVGAKPSNLRNLAASWNNYKKPERGNIPTDIDLLVLREIEDHLITVENSLIQDPDYTTYLISCVSNEIDELEGNIGLDELRKLVISTHNDIVRSFYYRGSEAGPNGSGLEFKQFKNRMFRRIENEITDSYEYYIEMALDIYDRRNSEPNIVANAENAANVTILNDEFKDILENYIGTAYGIKNYKLGDLSNSGNVSTRVTAKALKKEIREAEKQIRKETRERRKLVKRIKNLTKYSLRKGKILEQVSPVPRVDEHIFLPQVKKALVQEFESTGMTYNESVAEAENVIDSISDVVNSYYENINIDSLDTKESIVEDYVLLPSDLPQQGENNIDRLINKINHIYVDILKMPVPIDLFTDLQEEFSEKGFIDSKWANEESDKLVRMVIAQDVDELNGHFGTKLNPTPTQLAKTIDKFFDRMFSSSAMSQWASKNETEADSWRLIEDTYNKLGWKKEPPTPHFDSEDVQFMISQARLSDDVGGVTTTVQTNGSLVKEHQGLVFLPATDGTVGISVAVDRDGNPWTRDSLQKNAALKPGMRLHYIQLDSGAITIGEFLDDVNGQYSNYSGDIRYYDPLMNIHGLSRYNLPQGIDNTTREWHRISRMVERIDAIGMEEMALRAKKVLGFKDVIASPKIGRAIRKDNWPDTTNLSSDTEIFVACYDILYKSREAYAEVFAKEFGPKGDLKKLYYGDEQAMMLSSFLIPGIEVFLDNDERIVIDASHLFDSDPGSQDWHTYYEKKFKRTDEQGNVYYPSVIDAKPFVVSPKSISHRIMSRTNGATVNDDTEKIAMDALNWDDFIPGTLKMNRVLNRISPYGRGFSAPILFSNSQNGPQVLLDITSDMANGSSSHGRVKLQRKYYDHIHYDNHHSQDYNLWKEAKILSKAIGLGKKKGNKQEYGPVVRVYMPSKNSDGMMSKQSFITASEYDYLRGNGRNNNVLVTSLLDGSSYTVKGNEAGSCFLVLSKKISDIEEAVREGVKTGNIILIPKDSRKEANEFLDNNDFINSSDEIITININGNKKRMAVIKPENRITSNIPASAITSQWITRDRGSVARVLVDKDHIFNLGDSAVYAALTGPQRAGISKLDYVVLSAHRMIQHGGKKRLLNKEELMQLRERLYENGQMTRSRKKLRDLGIDLSVFQGKSTDAILNEMEDFFRNLDSDTVEQDGVRRSNVGKNSCLAILTNKSENSDSYNEFMFVPIMAPNNTFENLDYVNVVVSGDDIYIPHGGQLTVEESTDALGRKLEEAIKMSMYGEEAFKGIVTVMPQEINGKKFLGATIGVDTLIRDDINYFIDGDTESSRATGKEIIFLRRSLYEANLFYGGSTLFVEEKGELKPSEYIRNAIADNSNNWTQDLFYDFCRGGKTATDMVLRGQLRLSDDNRLNSLMIRVIRNGIKNRGSWLAALSRKAYDSEGNIGDLNTDFNPHTMFKGFRYDDLLYFYSKMGQFELQGYGKVPLCVNSISESSYSGNKPSAIFDAYGDTFTTIHMENDNGKVTTISGFFTVRWGEPVITSSASSMHTSSGTATYAAQQQQMRGMDVGINTQEQKSSALRYSEFLSHNYSYISKLARSKAREKLQERRFRDLSNTSSDNVTIEQIIQRFPNASWNECQHKLRTARNKFTHSETRNIIGTDGNPINTKHPEYAKIQVAMGEIRNLLGWENCSDMFIDILVRLQDGATINITNLDENNVKIVDWLASANTIIQNLKEDKPLAIRAFRANNGRSGTGRIALPGLVQFELDLLWEKSPKFRAKWKENKDDFLAENDLEIERAVDIINSLDQRERPMKIRLNEYMEWLHDELGKEFKNDQYIYASTWQADMDEMTNEWIKYRREIGDINEEQYQAYEELRLKYQNALNDITAATRRSDKKVSAKTNTTPNGQEVALYYDLNYAENQVLNQLVQWVQALSFINPYMPIANGLDKGVHQSFLSWSLRYARGEGALGSIGQKVTPYRYKDVEHAFTEEDKQWIINQPEWSEFFIEWREASMRGLENEFLAQAAQSSDILTWIRQQREERKNMTGIWGKANRFCDFWFNFGTFGKWGMRRMMNNFLDRWVMFIEEDEVASSYWFAKDENGETNFHKQMLANPTKVLMDALGANRSQTLILQPTLNAMNSARTGDMAQRHALGMILGYFLNNHPGAKLVSTTLISKFPEYGLNITHRMLNWVLPMSTIYYVWTERLAETKLGQQIHTENAHINTSLAEALRVDMLHLGTSLMVIVLVHLSGAVEPPEDDRYLCNIDEWTILGHRVREAWWMRDILGMVIPLACWTQSCMIGKPQFGLLIDGVIDACYANPFLHVGDAINLFVNPEGNIFEQYDDAVRDYEKHHDDPLTVEKFIQGQLANGTMSWASQFITPGFVRELAKLPGYERTYKKVYKQDKLGAEKDETKTEYVDYVESQMRRFTRSNPFIALIMDAIAPRQTGWAEWEMPYNLYYDDEQLKSIEDSAMEDPEILISLLQGYQHNMDDLKATGFYMDYDTKARVSQAIWDHYYEAKTRFNLFASNEGADYTLLGGGNFAYGKQLFYEYKEQCEEEQRYWKQFYYDCIKNSYLSEPMQVYYRQKTDYAVDNTGQIYATGFQKTPFLPIPVEFAPGTTKLAGNNPEGTAGYENNWNSISAVTGNPMGQRALVPINQENEEWPDFEEWAADGNGNSFSLNYNGQYGNGTENAINNSNNSSSGSGSRSGSSGGRRSGGGSGGSGGSGGGGRGYYQAPPRISIQSSSNYPVSPSRVMNSNRRTESDDVSYLRPGFETKGSREAYKRGDI